jgi:hypothetical protein
MQAISDFLAIKKEHELQFSAIEVTILTQNSFLDNVNNLMWLLA